jgi:hypothetical protein
MSTICNNNTDCPSNDPICNQSSRTCVQCIQTKDCALGYYCNNSTSIGQCVQISNCGADVNCASYSPYIKCTNQKNQIDGTCVQCLSDGNCMTGETCINSLCKSGIVNCSNNSDCSSSQICSQGICKNNVLNIALIVAIILAVLIVIIVIILFIIKKTKI